MGLPWHRRLIEWLQNRPAIPKQRVLLEGAESQRTTTTLENVSDSSHRRISKKSQSHRVLKENVTNNCSSSGKVVEHEKSKILHV